MNIQNLALHHHVHSTKKITTNLGQNVMNVIPESTT